MRNNKVVLSLVVASIAAMASVPDLLRKEKSDDSKNDVINLKVTSNVTTGEQIQLQTDIKNQMETIWSKKTPATKVGESVDVLVENYGSGDINIKSKIYEELKLGLYTGSSNDKDSTSISPGGVGGGSGATTHNAVPIMSCHAACHSACHSACHGSRGWRETNKN